MKRLSQPAVAAAVLIGFALALPAAVAAPKKPPTIKDLENQQVDVSPNPPQNVDSAKTMDSYKRFLDLNAGDAALRSGRTLKPIMMAFDADASSTSDSLMAPTPA